MDSDAVPNSWLAKTSQGKTFQQRSAKGEWMLDFPFFLLHPLSILSTVPGKTDSELLQLKLASGSMPESSFRYKFD